MKILKPENPLRLGFYKLAVWATNHFADGSELQATVRARQTDKQLAAIHSIVAQIKMPINNVSAAISNFESDRILSERINFEIPRRRIEALGENFENALEVFNLVTDNSFAPADGEPRRPEEMAEVTFELASHAKRLLKEVSRISDQISQALFVSVKEYDCQGLELARHSLDKLEARLTLAMPSKASGIPFRR